MIQHWQIICYIFSKKIQKIDRCKIL